MNPSTWLRAKDLLAEALGRPAADRAAFLDARCSDPALRAEIDELLTLQTHDVTGPAERSAEDDHGGEGDLPSGSTVGGRYLILDTIGRGGMGRVFLGKDTSLHRKVALKSVLGPAGAGTADRRRIVREARAAAQINHPNVAIVHDVLDLDSRAFIVMEYVEGESLSALLRRGRMPFERVMAIGRQLASALTAAHAKGVIHRDLKPRNIHLAVDGSVKVLDFGVAATTSAFTTASGTDDERTARAQPGTPGYMAPEQVLRQEVDERSDLFALGIVLFEMATGERVFPERDALGLALALSRPIRRADAVDPRVPRGLADVIARALEIDPARRFQSATAVLEALDALSAGASPVVPYTTWLVRAAVALPVLVIALGVLGFLTTAELDWALGRGHEFSDHSPWSWVIAGTRSVLTTIAYAAIYFISYQIVVTVVRLASRMVPALGLRLERVKAAVGRRLPTALRDADTAAQWLLVAQALALGLSGWAFWDLLAAMTTQLSNAEPRVLQRLVHDAYLNHHLYLYQIIVSAVLFGSVLGWYFLIVVRRRERHVQRSTIGAGLVLATITLLALDVPNGLFFQR